MTPKPKVNVLEATWITPSTPTPPSKARTPLSDWDTVMFNSYTPLLFFYINKSKDPAFMNTYQLKKSLSDVLTDYYPLAGRLVDIGNGRDEISNTDAGVLFQEAEYLDQLEKYRPSGYLPNQLDYHRMFPIHFYSSPQDPLLAVQITRFQDGGVALGVMMLHKIADTYSLSLFLDAWAKKSRGQAYPYVCFSRNIIGFDEQNTNITEDAFKHYQDEHRLLTEDLYQDIEMDPQQHRYARTSRNGPEPLKSIVLEFFAGGLYQCRKDAHSNDSATEIKKSVTSKEALLSMLYRAIARSRNVDPDTNIRMTTSVNGRSIMVERKGIDAYFGNLMVSRTITIKKSEVEDISLGQTAMRLHNSISQVDTRLLHGISKLYTLHGDMTVNYLTCQPNSEKQATASDASALPFWRLNFGHGAPDRTRGYITFGGNGCLIIFGRGDRTEGPMYDVQVQMDTESMRRFIDDPDIKKYANSILF
ncbi:transferase-domain-containing protein [Backusella circina FSU 941]|nr:transferase-domain-containing protein [Backusella circina FSU 941]